MPTPVTNEPFGTSDLSLASFLCCTGCSIIQMQRQGGSTVFLFADSPQLQEALLGYINDEPVPVRSFSSTVRDLEGLSRSGAFGERS